MASKLSAEAVMRHAALLRPGRLQAFQPASPSRQQARPRRLPAVRAAVVSELAGLQAFLSSQGVELSKAAVAVTPAGLVTSRQVSRGEALFEVPEAAWVTPKAVAESPLGAAVAELEPWLAITLWLLHERSKPASQYKPYLDSLEATAASHPGSPLLWSEAELELLAGTQLLGSVQSYRAYFQERYLQLQGGLLSPSGGLFAPEACSFEAFLRAVCLVRACVHAPLEGANLALVPLADMVQHRRGRSATLQLRSGGLFGRGQALALEAEAGMGAGEPVAIDFGPGKTDGQVLLDHGVLDQAAPSAGYALTLAPGEADPFLYDKLDIMELAGLPESVELLLRGDGKLDERLLPLLRLLALSGPDAFLLESVFRNEAWGHMQLPVSEGNEAAVCQQLIDGCRAALAGYPTTIDQDLALLRSAVPASTSSDAAGGAAAADGQGEQQGAQLVLGSRAHVAVRVRLGEKEALDATLQVMETRLGQVKDLEFYAERRLKGLGLLDDQGNRKPADWDSFFDQGIA